MAETITTEHVLPALAEVNRALADALAVNVPGTIAIGRDDGEDDGCVHLGLLVEEETLNPVQAAAFRRAKETAEVLNGVIRRLDEAGTSVMLTLRADVEAPLVFVGTASRGLRGDQPIDFPE